MKLPRDVSGEELAALLQRHGYQVTRQTGSHMRLTTLLGGEHHITIPHHRALRIGTLSAILNDVARHLKMDREALVESLWGKSRSTMEGERRVREAMAAYAVSVRHDLSEPLMLEHCDERVVLERDGKPLAVLFPYDEYLRLVGITFREQLHKEVEQYEQQWLEDNKAIAFWVEQALEGQWYFAQARGHLIVAEGDTYEEVKERIQDSVRRRFAEDKRSARVRLDVVRHEVMPV
jgi:predicted RNA binding protein YcfA (HicA-like mRNA interferase family)